MTTRSDVLSALRGAGPSGISGEALAGQLGVSRVAIGKHVAALREAGYEIEAVLGSGYQLLSAPDLPLPSEVEPLLRSQIWAELSGGGETGSTNDDARALARAGAPEGSVVLAARQSAGRGRLGRTWISPDGGAYLSVVLRPAVAPVEAASLGLAVALGVVRGLETLGARPLLKWPNDVLLGDGKLAGILLEMSAESDAVDWVIAGVGLNVRPPADAPRTPGAAYLSDVAEHVGLARAMAAELDGIAEAYEQWRSVGFPAMRGEYEARFALTGRQVRVRDLAGTVRAAGEVTGVDEGGRLLVRAQSGAVTPVVAGEVTLRE
ncbi:MAG: biotin--[acetyl-CoA-carboxylase] ligase [Coriobacteriia bacterium]|nr:biotin--[acetyl-CoA-carboxylase] ligase [Coriobacteriia bacterium]